MNHGGSPFPNTTSIRSSVLGTDENVQLAPPSVVWPISITSVALPDGRPRGGSSHAGIRLAPAGVISPTSSPFRPSLNQIHSNATSEGFFANSVRTGDTSAHDVPPLAVCSSLSPSSA